MISDEELEALTLAIKRRYAIDFTQYEKKSLKRGFARMINKNKMKSILDLWSIILKQQDFFKQCIDDLYVNLTELFRNPEIWRVLAVILSDFKDQQEIKIWHAGCSTGEEVYSMAMIADSVGLIHKLNSVGTDISKAALEKAKKGVYPKMLLKKYERSLKSSLPDKTFDEMFTSTENGSEIKERFKQPAQFRSLDLVTQKMYQTHDIVFCRNVMIYFDNPLKQKVIDTLLDALQPNGYLVLGYYDILPEVCTRLLKPFDSKNHIYQKK